MPMDARAVVLHLIGDLDLQTVSPFYTPSAGLLKMGRLAMSRTAN